MPCVENNECGKGGICYDVLQTIGPLNGDAILSTLTNDIMNSTGNGVGLGLVSNKNKNEMAKLSNAIDGLKQCIINDYTKNMK